MKISNKALTEYESSKTFPCIDLMKFICSLLVLMIHVPPFQEDGILALLDYFIVYYLARIAVPFFFVTSGYLLFRKTKRDSYDVNISIKYCKKILFLYVVWTLIYSIFIFRHILLEPKGILWGIIQEIKAFLFSGSYTHLWYLNATIVGVALVSLCLYFKMKVNHILIIGTGLYLVGLVAQSYYGLFEPIIIKLDLYDFLKGIEKIITTTRNGVFEGFLFIGIGMLFAYRPITMKFRNAILGFIGSMILLLIEYVGVTKLGWARAYDMYLLLVPATFFLFYIVSHVELEDKPIYRLFRNMSSLIFYIHLWVSNIYNFLFHSNNQGKFFSYNFLFVLLFSIVGSFLIIKLSNINRFKWLRKLY